MDTHGSIQVVSSVAGSDLVTHEKMDDSLCAGMILYSLKYCCVRQQHDLFWLLGIKKNESNSKTKN